jgi:hypothetical protein
MAPERPDRRKPVGLFSWLQFNSFRQALPASPTGRRDDAGVLISEIGINREFHPVDKSIHRPLISIMSNH